MLPRRDARDARGRSAAAGADAAVGAGPETDDVEAFRRRLAALDRGRFTDLLARLCAARGRTVRADGAAGVVVERDPRRRADVDGPAALPDPDADGPRARVDLDAPVDPDADGPDATTRYLVVPSRGLVGRLLVRLAPGGADGRYRGIDAGAVDVVVGADPGDARRVADALDARAWGPAALLRFAGYGVDRGDAAPIVADALDASLDDLLRAAAADRPARSNDAPAPTPKAGQSGASGSAGGSRRLLASVALVVGVVLVATLVAPLPGVPSPAGAPGTGGAASPTAPAADRAADGDLDSSTGADPGSPPPGLARAPDDAATARDGPSGDGSGESPLAPGLVLGDGVVDVDALASAHGRSVANRSYRWERTYVVSRDGREVTRATERVRLISPSRYVSTVDRNGSAFTDASPISWTETYGDGTTRWVRTVHPWFEGNLDVGDVRREPLDDHPGGVHAENAEWIVERHLAAEETAIERVLIRNWSRLYVLDLDGSPEPNWADYDGTAIVTPDGMVTSMYASYRIPDSNVTVRFSYLYRPLDAERLSPPDWVPATAPGGNESDERDVTTAVAGPAAGARDSLTPRP